ncbi:TetR/AcrR family transcriptional regulator [Epilithonimonas arachidiradicis]|uniref:TetR family transcriptional regulator n=1 Tax=Epilithonimonas arachidiradicis TaxID=1617282 RepID=A0A420DBX9_9FLAO|nr:TetR/AcrR family transcriptional regulator [Epilithonimonas arachidiradicis]RKE88971.1 TetR family transcriptional regulator [Epilithonimonas arachidiradicis]GGG53596.1 TetR family transcriptional regulator [Epilithonimonas arachidiradicis]
MPTKEEHIMMVAEKLFAANGYNGTSVRDIATKAKVNVSMISYYFGSKENLMEELFKWRMEEGLNFAKNILENNELNEIQKIDAFIDNFVNRVQRLRDFFLLVHTQQVISQNKNIQNFLRASKINYIEINQKIIEQGLEKGIFTKKPSYHLLQCTISGTIFNAMHGIKIYKEYLKKHNSDFDEKLYENQYFQEASDHVKTIVRALVGYQN